MTVGGVVFTLVFRINDRLLVRLFVKSTKSTTHNHDLALLPQDTHESKAVLSQLTHRLFIKHTSQSLTGNPEENNQRMEEIVATLR